MSFGQEPDPAHCLFDNTLIVGASVSQGIGAKPGGPSKIIAKELNPEAQVKIIAKHQKKSTESMLGYIEITPPSIVMGLDLFYWDAIKDSCDKSFEEYTRSFFQSYQDRNIPLIIGRLPIGITQPSGYNLLNKSECTPAINKLINELCTVEKNCLIYDPADCMKAIKKDADENFGVKRSKVKKKYLNVLLDEYFVDDVHPSDTGNQFCAEQFLLQKAYQVLKCVKR